MPRHVCQAGQRPLPPGTKANLTSPSVWLHRNGITPFQDALLQARRTYYAQVWKPESQILPEKNIHARQGSRPYSAPIENARRWRIQANNLLAEAGHRHDAETSLPPPILLGSR